MNIFGPNMTRNLAILGTGSHVGKSITATALLRILSNQGLNVAPFKAQNMSNNSFVARDGEMARAQAVQAEAARVSPCCDMNPVLLKPMNQTKAQLIIHGKAITTLEAREYFHDTNAIAGQAWSSLENLKCHFDLIVLEGAGSCAEMNLRHVDFCNFMAAKKANANVILVADIDRGGVFAQILGTLDLLSEEERNQIKAIIINRFRGDLSLFDDGKKFIEQKSGIPILGVIPHFSHIRIDDEDGLSLDAVIDPRIPLNIEKINIGIILLPQISNFTDFAPLSIPNKTAVHFLRSPRDLSEYDAVILPGSKNTRDDLAWLHQSGWHEKIINYRSCNRLLIGICGGYQMLGEVIEDPDGVESKGSSQGFAFLPLHTTLFPQKYLSLTEAECLETKNKIYGYEIHHGKSVATAPHEPMLRIVKRNQERDDCHDGMISADKSVWGCYVHGLFDNENFLLHFLQSFKKQQFYERDIKKYITERDHHYNLLADHFSSHINMGLLRELIS